MKRPNDHALQRLKRKLKRLQSRGARWRTQRRLAARCHALAERYQTRLLEWSKENHGDVIEFRAEDGRVPT